MLWLSLQHIFPANYCKLKKSELTERKVIHVICTSHTDFQAKSQSQFHEINTPLSCSYHFQTWGSDLNCYEVTGQEDHK